jgi:hypothetical protein
MSLQDLEKVVIKLGSDIKEDTIACLIESVRTRYDKYGRLVVQLFLHCSRYGKVIFNYSPQKAKMLLESFRTLGIEDTIIGRCFEFKKVKVEKLREDYTEPYPAWLPSKIISCNYIE